MCGIPTTPPPDAVTGKKLSFEQVMEHLGGELVTEAGQRMIYDNCREYMWSYPGRVAHCTACRATIEGIRAGHRQMIRCPVCGREVEFRHEGKGHKRLYDHFVMYEWRRSALDPEAVALTAAYCWRDSTGPRPEGAPLNIEPAGVYLFRPGQAVTVYKSYYSWYREMRYWNAVRHIAPVHTSHSKSCEIVISEDNFREALAGTRLGRTYWALCAESHRVDTLELMAIANCARRPWLEYLAKAGQARLAAELMRMNTIPKELCPNQRAKTPRALLGLTEAQWHEVRRDGVVLDADMLRKFGLLRRMGLAGHMWDMVDLAQNIDLWRLGEIAPSVNKPGEHHWRDTIGDMLNRLPIKEKLKRKVYRRIIGDFNRVQDWRDYYHQLHELGEDMTSPAMLLPRDMPEMHQRMIERRRILKEEAEAEKLALASLDFDARLKKLQKKYTFRAAGLLLRPYESAREVVDEGRALDICIGMYARRYMEGGTVICCLRREEEPDLPWRAVEINAITGAVVQDRGAHNDTRGGIEPGTKKQLRLFWAAYDKKRRRKSA